MKRAVVFAHYDKQNLVDDYVIYYLKALKEVAEDIIFVSCNNIVNPEKLEGVVSYVIDEPHDEYDFGSYKRGFLYLEPRLNEFDELVFVNDSCFGPFYPFGEIFDEMDAKDCDFWGMTRNKFGINRLFKLFECVEPHVQSYFLVFKKNILTSKFFFDFMSNIKHEEVKTDIINKYEIGLTKALVNEGFKYQVYINAYENVSNLTINKWRQIILKHRMPLMKCSLPRLINKNSTTVEGYEDIIKQVSDYPVELIQNNVSRIPYVRKGRHTSPIFIKRFVFDIVAGFPFLIRKFILLFISRCMPFLRD